MHHTSQHNNCVPCNVVIFPHHFPWRPTLPVMAALSAAVRVAAPALCRSLPRAAAVVPAGGQHVRWMGIFDSISKGYEERKEAQQAEQVGTWQRHARHLPVWHKCLPAQASCGVLKWSTCCH